jgi:dihydrofolate reductase
MAGRAGGDSKGPSTRGEPGTDALAALSKVVFSTTLSEPLSWANTQVVAQDPVEAVREMKDKAATSMRTIGSLTLCRSLLKAGLADRFRVVVFPVITGSSGRERIYDGYPDVALDMTGSRTFDGRIQLLEYVPTILAGPRLWSPPVASAASGHPRSWFDERRVPRELPEPDAVKQPARLGVPRRTQAGDRRMSGARRR